MFDILFFTNTSGKNPVKEFVKKQDSKAKRKIYRAFDLIKKFGFRLPGGQVKKMTGTKDLWELRVKYGGRNYRFFMASVNKQIILLLHAIAKKRQKTPIKDIVTAQTRLREYKQ